MAEPLPGSPMIVFVNCKSGGGHGERFLRRFKQILNPGQVFDIANEGPTFGLEVYRYLAPLHLLVCGGDGSVGWVLKEIDQLQLRVYLWTGRRMSKLVLNVKYLLLLSFFSLPPSFTILQFGAHSRYYKAALTQKRSFSVLCTTFRSDFHVG